MTVRIASLDHLDLFGIRLSAEEVKALPERVRELVCAAFADALNRAAPGEVGKKFKFNVDYTAKGTLVLEINEKKLGEIKGDFSGLHQTLAKVLDVVQYWLPGRAKAFDNPEKEVSENTLIAEFEKTMLDYRKGQSQSFAKVFKTGREANGVGIDLISLARNPLGAFEVVTPWITTLAAFIQGPMAVLAGTGLFKAGDKLVERAAAVGDKEGLVEGRLLKWGIGAGYGTLGAMLLPANFFEFFTEIGVNTFTNGVTTTLATAAATAVGVFGLVLYSAQIVSALHGLHYVGQFRTELNEILKRDSFDRDKAVAGLRFLESQITLTEGDWKELERKGETSKEAVEKKLQEKWDRFVRRVGQKCALEVQSAMKDGLLEKVRWGQRMNPEDRFGHEPDKNKPLALDVAKRLIDSVERESFKQLVKQALLLVIGIIGLTAFIIGFAMTGPAAPLLFMIAAGFWLFADCKWLQNWLGETAANVKDRLVETPWKEVSRIEPGIARWVTRVEREQKEAEQEERWAQERDAKRAQKAPAEPEIEVEKEAEVETGPQRNAAEQKRIGKKAIEKLNRHPPGYFTKEGMKGSKTVTPMSRSRSSSESSANTFNSDRSLP